MVKRGDAYDPGNSVRSELSGKPLNIMLFGLLRLPCRKEES